jgi:hypothetical protein
MPAEVLYNLTKNLTVHLQHNLCAVLPKEGKRRNAYAFQFFLTLKNFLYDEHWLAMFSWGSNKL